MAFNVHAIEAFRMVKTVDSLKMKCALSAKIGFIRPSIIQSSSSRCITLSEPTEARHTLTATTFQNATVDLLFQSDVLIYAVLDTFPSYLYQDEMHNVP